MLIQDKDQSRKGEIAKEKECNNKSDQVIKEFSITRLQPFISKFHLGLHHTAPCLDPNDVFHCEALHNLHLGVTKILPFLMIERVENMSGRSGAVLSPANLFCREVDQLYRFSELHVDFSTSSKDYDLNRVLRSDGIMGTLEGCNFRNVEKVLTL